MFLRGKRSMCGPGIFKRLAPFFLTLAAGIFIAGLFIDISSPFAFRPMRMNRMREMDRLRIENEQLNRENQNLRRQLAIHERDAIYNYDLTAPGPAPNLDVQPPPPARVAPGPAVR